jgi:hypothetical protein
MTPRLNTAPTQNIGAGPRGTRVTFPITGGSFEGDRLRGKVLAGDDDWTVKRSDGVVELDLRITLETDDGALIHMTFEGIRQHGVTVDRVGAAAFIAGPSPSAASCNVNFSALSRPAYRQRASFAVSRFKAIVSLLLRG